MENSERDGNTRPPDLPLRNLYSGQEVAVRTRHGTTGLVPNQKRSTSRLHLVTLFNLYAEYIMRNAGLKEAQAGIQIAGRNISNLRYADDTTLIAESEEIKSLLMKVKEESEKVGLKLNRLVPNRERSTSRLYIVTLLIYLICRVYHT